MGSEELFSSNDPLEVSIYPAQALRWGLQRSAATPCSHQALGCRHSSLKNKEPLNGTNVFTLSPGLQCPRYGSVLLIHFILLVYY